MHKNNTLLVLISSTVLLAASIYVICKAKQSSPAGDRDSYVFLSKRDLLKGEKPNIIDLELKIVGESKVPQMAIWNPDMATQNKIIYPVKKGEILDTGNFGLNLKEEPDLGASRWKILSEEEIASFIQRQKYSQSKGQPFP